MKKVWISGLLVAVVVVVWLAVTPDRSLSALKEKYAAPPSRFIAVHGMDVHYRIEGEGPTVVLLHGTGSSLHTWEGWTRALSKEFRVVRLDLPAFGLTGPNANGDYRIETYVSFLKAFLDRLGITKSHLAGNSLGGRVAWAFALRHVDAVASLILIDASGLELPGDPPPGLPFRLASTPVLNSLLSVLTPKSLHRRSLLDAYGDASKASEELVTRYYELMLRPGNRAAFVDRANTAHNRNALRKGALGCPTLIVWGDEDIWIPVSHAHRFKELIPQAELAIFDGVGHMPMEEVPALSSARALEFLRKHR